MFFKKAFVGFMVFGSCVGVFPSLSHAEQNFVTIGTGSVTGVYYPAGGAICRLVNKGRKDHNIRCSVEATGGSAENIDSIRSRDMDMGIVQSDIQYNAYLGQGDFKTIGPFNDLRAIFSIHPEPFTVLARADSGIKHFQDLQGKRVNIGNTGSGQRSNMEVLMTAWGWTKNDFSQVSELNASEQAKALCNNEIDAMVYTVGHPNGSIKEAAASCDTLLVDVTGEAVDRLIADHKYYRIVTIPGGLYRGNPQDTKTFGVGATFVTSKQTADITIYEVTKSVFENFTSFQKLHPAFRNLKKEEMVKDGLSAPLHDGAMKYFKEVGLFKSE
jgi:uncharacterized protein